MGKQAVLTDFLDIDAVVFLENPDIPHVQVRGFLDVHDVAVVVRGFHAVAADPYGLVRTLVRLVQWHLDCPGSDVVEPVAGSCGGNLPVLGKYPFRDEPFLQVDNPLGLLF